MVPAKMKSALTRALNKMARKVPYNEGAVLTKGRKRGPIPVVGSLEIDEEGKEIELKGNEVAIDDEDDEDEDT